MRDGNDEPQAERSVKRLFIQRLVLRALIAVFAVSAVVLTGGKLRPDRQWTGVLLEPPMATRRMGEQMSFTRLTGAINVNLANVDELCQIVGVGEKLAARMMEERTSNGRFVYPEDLLNVQGIGEKTLQKLLPQICME